jgi:hypothetical protein
MANVFSSNPVYIDTDTTVVATTNWRGALGGSKYTGGIGIRPAKIVITGLSGTTVVGLVTINEINSTGGGTGPVLFKALVNSTTFGSQEFDFTGSSPGWHDFIVTGVTASGVVLEIYYRV